MNTQRKLIHSIRSTIDVIVIGGILSTTLFANLKGYKEKFITKTVVTINDHTLTQLYTILGYKDKDHNILIYDKDDVDTNHIIRPTIRFENIYHQNDIVVDEKVYYTLYDSPCEKNNFFITAHMNVAGSSIDQFVQNYDMNSNEVKSILIALMYISVAEQVEQIQLEHKSQIIVKSGYNHTDLRGNVLGVLKLCEDYHPKGFYFPLQSDRLIILIQQLQNIYHKTYPQDLFHALQHDLGFSFVCTT